MLHVGHKFPYARPLFADRAEAGERLRDFVSVLKPKEPIVLAIPRGGLPIGCPIAQRLGAPLDVIAPRKLPLPDSPEAGFGAIAPDGTIILNESLAAQARLSEETIRAIAQEVLDEVRRRVRLYRGDRPFPSLADRDVILVDDGLATGYTMLAAIDLARKAAARRVLVAVPVSPMSSLHRVNRKADEVYCLAAQEKGGFAVASFYRSFPDMLDDEVKLWLSRVTV